MCTPDLFLLTVMWAKLTQVLGFRLQVLGFAVICRDMQGYDGFRASQGERRLKWKNTSNVGHFFCSVGVVCCRGVKMRIGIRRTA